MIPATHASYLVPADFQDYSLFTIRLHVGRRLPGEAGIPEGSLCTSGPFPYLLVFAGQLSLVDRSFLHECGFSFLFLDLTLVACLSDQVTSFWSTCVTVLLLPVDSSQASHQVVLTPPHPHPPLTSPTVCLFSAIGECHYSLKGLLSSKYFLYFNHLNERSIGS